MRIKNTLLFRSKRVLKKLLNELEYSKHKETDRNLIAPEILENKRGAMLSTLTKAFTHYYKQLNTGKHLTYGVLRKTYITKSVMLLGLENACLITRHSTIKVMDKNYINKPLIAQTGETLKMLK